LFNSQLSERREFMPQRDGKGPPWGGGPGTGRRRQQFSSPSKDSFSSSGSGSQNLLTFIGSAIALAASIVKLFSAKKEKKAASASQKE
jgi:hypothetical protein